MATTDLLFPFYEILVENIFGSVGLALLGLAMIMLLILFICKTSWNFIIFYITFYAMVTLTFYVGAIGIVLMFILSLTYAVTAIIKFISENI